MKTKLMLREMGMTAILPSVNALLVVYMYVGQMMLSQFVTWPSCPVGYGNINQASSSCRMDQGQLNSITRLISLLLKVTETIYQKYTRGILMIVIAL